MGLFSPRGWISWDTPVKASAVSPGALGNLQRRQNAHLDQGVAAKLHKGCGDAVLWLGLLAGKQRAGKLSLLCTRAQRKAQRAHEQPTHRALAHDRIQCLAVEGAGPLCAHTPCCATLDQPTQRAWMHTRELTKVRHGYGDVVELAQRPHPCRGLLLLARSTPSG